MSFTETSGLGPWQKLGCALAVFVGSFVTVIGAVFNALGSRTEENAGPLVNFIAFPGSFLFFLALGVAMIFLFRQHNDRK